MNEYTVYRTKNTIGCYGTDREGNQWATFEAINHTYQCVECGKHIDRGWVKGKLGDELHYCSEHVVYTETGGQVLASE